MTLTETLTSAAPGRGYEQVRKHRRLDHDPFRHGISGVKRAVKKVAALNRKFHPLRVTTVAGSRPMVFQA